MRRRVQCLFVALALMVGLVLPALAAEPEVIVVKEADGGYTVSYAAGLGNAGKPFSLRVISSADAGDVLYLAQADADVGGMVEFQNVRPTIIRGARFLISGGTLAAPVETSVAVPGTVVMGQVSRHGKRDCSGVVVTFAKMGDPTETYTYKTRYDGSYLTDALPRGLYEITIESMGYWNETLKVTLDGEDFFSLGAVTLYGSCDINEDSTVDEKDMAPLLADFGKRNAGAADINGDGYVNGGDLSLLKERIEQITGTTPDRFPSLEASLNVVKGHDGVYKLWIMPAFSGGQNETVRRIEAMISWDSSLLTLADSAANYAAITPADGANQNAHSGVASFKQGSGGAVFFTGTGRSACYLAVSGGKEDVLPDGGIYLRLKPGKTVDDLRKGSIRVERDPADGGFLSRALAASNRYGALIGYGGTVTQTFPGELSANLDYPNSDKAVLASVDIQSDSRVLTIPTADSGEETVLPLTAVGRDTEGDEMVLSEEPTWLLVSAPQGVTLAGNKLCAGKDAQSGKATVRATSSGISVDKVIAVSVDLGPSTPTSVSMKRSGTVLGAGDRLTVPGSGSRDYTYTAAVLDQYELEMAETDGVEKITWSLTTADDKVSLQNGVLTVAAGADLTKSYTLTATADRLSKSVTITLATESNGGGGGSITPPKGSGVVVSGDGSSTIVKVESVKGKDGSYTATLDDVAAAEILKAAADKTGPVVITAVAGEKDTKATLILPASMSGGLAKAGRSLVVELPAARLEVASAQLGKLGGGLSVSAQQTGGGRTVITFDTNGKEICFTAILPTAEPAAGLVAMLVGTDGTLAPVRKSALVDSSMVVPMTGSATLALMDNSKPFSDMAGSWAAGSVAFVSARELFSGSGADTFSPGLEMSRGMLATVLYRLEGERKAESAAAFPDVAAGAWYEPGAAWAAERGIVTGKADGTFDPEGLVTREEMALMLYRLAAPEKTDPPVEQHSFTDVGDISPWAAQAMDWAISTGLLTGKSGSRLDPGGTATRAEVAVMLERFVKMECGKGGAK